MGWVDDLTNEFLAESHEGLERMERCLTELERRPKDRELLAEIFRSVHTIKGTTGFLGFGRLEALAHAGENLLGALRDGELAVTPELVSGLLRLMDRLRAILRLIEQTGSEGTRAQDEDGELIEYLLELRSAPGAPGFAPQRMESAGDGGTGAEAEVEAARRSLELAGGPGSPEKTLRIGVDVLNRMMNLVGELVLTRNRILQGGFDAENFSELARRLDTVTADLRGSVMQARMQPVGYLFGTFSRMVRDLALACGRQARIEFEGQETGLDKSLLEAIRDPLTHAVRNAVDHGIEPPEVRAKTGKSAEGLVRLRAFQQSGSVVIEVSDDGGGIPVERVLAKAVERGLASAEQAAGMSEAEALQMVFLPGFSTADRVTHVSGRGVGMDVVRTNLEKVGGTVELESRVGSGTTLRMRVPMTVAIVPALIVRSRGESFAVPQSSLVELVYVPREEAETAVERMGRTKLYRLRERMLPLVWLDRMLELTAAEEQASRGFYIAVVDSEGCRFGLVVDELLAPEEIVVKPLSSVLREIGVYSGATVLGSGTLAMILDVAGVRACAGVRPAMEGLRRPAPTAGSAAAKRMDDPMVIFEVHAGERIAMPMRSLERIESVAAGAIEFAAGRAVMQYRGEVLPVEDEGGVLREAGMGRDAGVREKPPAPGQWVSDSWEELGVQTDAAMVTVLICAQGAKRLAMVVRRVVDVSPGTLLENDADVCAGQIAIVKDRVTTVHREFAVAAQQAVETLREVA